MSTSKEHFSNELLLEYKGEVISREEGNRRYQTYEHDGKGCFIFDIHGKSFV